MENRRKNVVVESCGSKGEERRVDLGGGRWFWVSYDGGKRWKIVESSKWKIVESSKW